VRSVALFARRPAEALGGATVLLSESSRTSVQLLQLLCRDVWDVRPKFVEARAEAADIDGLAALPHDGVLVIGDAALVLAARGIYPYRYDLGEVWKAWTGLPFVFAVWAARRDANAAAARAVHDRLCASRDWGLRHLDELAREAAARTGIAVDACAEYLDGLDYALSYRHLEGLTGFFRRLAARGVVRNGELSFLSVA
jgi:chorismate dehydratase